MQSAIQKKSYNSAQVFWLNKNLLRKNISDAVKALAVNRPEVQKVVLFGSVAEGRETVSSDIDILLIVKQSTRRFIDRPLEFRNFFEDIGLGVDIFVYTQDEIKRGINLPKTALEQGKVLFKRQAV